MIATIEIEIDSFPKLLDSKDSMGLASNKLLVTDLHRFSENLICFLILNQIHQI